MDRRRAFAVAAAAALIVAGGAFAAGANLGLFGIASSSATPALPITDNASTPPATAPPSSGDEVRYVDVPITVAVPSGGAAVLPAETDDAGDGPAVGPTPPESTVGTTDPTPTTVPGVGEDHRDHEGGDRSTTSTTDHADHEFNDD